ncbi:hypothetical protein CsSME_00026199 [Camellia sinensis var. sinensis]
MVFPTEFHQVPFAQDHPNQGCLLVSNGPVITSEYHLFAACPEMKTVGLPNRLSFEIGPYFLTLSSSHCLAVLAFITWRRVRLWPMMGSPRDPGGSFCDDLVFFTRRKKMGMRNSRRRVRKGFMVERERSTD